MIKTVLIEGLLQTGVGAIDENGTIGNVEYMIPSVPLPDNMLTNKLEIRDGKPVYVVTFDDGSSLVFTVTYTGMDGTENEEEFDNLELAIKWKTFIEERGGQMITITDDEGNEY